MFSVKKVLFSMSVLLGVITSAQADILAAGVAYGGSTPADVKLVVAWTVKFTQPFCRLDLSPFDDLLSYRVDPDSSEPPRRVASCA